MERPASQLKRLERGESGTGVSAQPTNPLGRPVRARGLLRAAGAADRLSPHRERAGVALRPRGRCTSLSTVGVCCDERTSAQVSNPPSCAPPASASRAREPTAIIPLVDWGELYLHSFYMRLHHLSPRRQPPGTCNPTSSASRRLDAQFQVRAPYTHPPWPPRARPRASRSLPMAHRPTRAPLRPFVRRCVHAA